MKPRRCLLHGRVIRDGPSAICVKVDIRPTDLSPEQLSMNSCSKNKSDRSTYVGDLMLSGGAKRLSVKFVLMSFPKMIEDMLPRDPRKCKDIRRFGLIWMNRNISEAARKPNHIYHVDSSELRYWDARLNRISLQTFNASQRLSGSTTAS
jgi:hypothetical protein